MEDNIINQKVGVRMLRSFDPLRTRNAVSLAKDGAVTDDKIPLVGSGVLVAPPNASFLQRWWAEYRTFNRNKWNVHSCQLPRQLAESHADEANLLPHTAFYPRSWQAQHLAIAHKADDCRSEADSYAVHRYNSAVDGTAKGKWVPPADVEGDGAAELEEVWMGKGSLHRVARKILRKALAAGRLCPLAERVVRPLAAHEEPKCVPATKVPDPTVRDPSVVAPPKPATERQNRDDKTPTDQERPEPPKNDQSDTQAAERADGQGLETADKIGSATTKKRKGDKKSGSSTTKKKAGDAATLDDLLRAGMFGKKALGGR